MNKYNIELIIINSKNILCYIFNFILDKSLVLVRLRYNYAIINNIQKYDPKTFLNIIF